MTISGALSNAMLGLRAASRGAEIVSANVSNALTPGYARRVLSLSSQATAGTAGVRIGGIDRISNAGLAADRRNAEAEHNNVESKAAFLARLETIFGTPGDPNSLSGRLAEFESSLISAASRPDAGDRLEAGVVNARDLARSIAEASDQIQQARTQADQTIRAMVSDLNLTLEQVVRLNTKIATSRAQGGDTSALLDQRQLAVDRIGALVPIQELTRDNGSIALYTKGGAVLLDGPAATVGFEAANLVTTYMSQGASTLSGLTVNGLAVRTDSEGGALRGGAIGAQFTIRDELGVEAQSQLDTIARDLIERFQDPNVDTTLNPGDAGLFTDDGDAFDPVDQQGISVRLSLNAAVDPEQGGESWRLRDGINAAAQGNVGDANTILNLQDALSEGRSVPSSGFAGALFSLESLVSAVTSDVLLQRNLGEQKISFAAARLTELTERQLAEGVDSDAEIQRLLLLEQAYAANARVIEAVDEMMMTLVRI